MTTVYLIGLVIHVLGGAWSLWMLRKSSGWSEVAAVAFDAVAWPVMLPLSIGVLLMGEE